jgi:hypothetical protein
MTKLKVLEAFGLTNQPSLNVYEVLGAPTDNPIGFALLNSTDPTTRVNFIGMALYIITPGTSTAGTLLP